MNLTWTTSLRVFPQHCNHHNGMIFGGEMLTQMDLVAAAAVTRFLYDSPKGVSEALTVGVDKVTFHKGAKVGDLIIFTATITDVGQKRISVNVSAEKESLEEESKPKRDIKYSHNLETGVLHKQVNYEYAKVKKPVRSKMAEGTFHFCAYDMEKGKGTEHGIDLNRYKKSLYSWDCDSKDSPDGLCEDDEDNYCKYCNEPMDERK